MTAGVPGLGLSGLFTLLSALALPVTRFRNRGGQVAGLVALALATGGAVVAAWDATIVFVRGASTAIGARPAAGGGGFGGVPIIVVSLGILLVVLVAAEGLFRMVRVRPTPPVPARPRSTAHLSERKAA